VKRKFCGLFFLFGAAFQLAMATTKNIDTVLPPFLEHKVNARKATKLVGTKLFAQYANSGHIVIADLLSKKQKTIKFGDTLNIRQFDVSKHATHLAVVYGENVDDSTLAVCDLETGTLAIWNNLGMSCGLCDNRIFSGCTQSGRAIANKALPKRKTLYFAFQS
jgi:hypothetical protein